MPGAVLFDFYGTLAHWSDVERTSYTAVLADFGYTLPPDELEAYFARYDGVEHVEHSTDGPTYEAWVRHRLVDLTSACGVAAHHQNDVVSALRASDQAEMVAYEDAAPTLRSLRAAGVPIGVCSNWGWELAPYLDQVGLLPLVDVAVTSARAGARKPHPRVYAAALSALGVEARHTVFIGDSWGADVIGPRAVGMTAVHVWRPDDRSGAVPPELEGVPRIADLRQVLELLDALGVS